MSVDANDDFYEASFSWYANRIISELPQTKPYPLPRVKAILDEVLASGNESEKAQAQKFYERIFGKYWNVSASVKTENIFERQEFSDKRKKDSYVGRIPFDTKIFGDALFKNAWTLGWKAGVDFRFLDTRKENLLFRYAPLENDRFVKTLSLHKNVALDFLLDAIASYTNEKISVATGYARNGLQLFRDDSLVLSSSSAHSPFASFSVDTKRVDFLFSFKALEASSVKDNSYRFGKFLNFAAIRFLLGKHFYVSLYDAVVYGGRFDPSYFIPVPHVLITNANGYDDNVTMGAAFQWNLASSFVWTTELAVDTIDWTMLTHLKFNSDNRLAAKTELLYAPRSAILKFVSFDYTIVAPYMYSHWNNGDAFEWTSHANGERSLGTSLPPNSDMARLKVRLEVLKGFFLETHALVARHGNIYEGLAFPRDDDPLKAKKLEKFENEFNAHSIADGSIHTMNKDNADSYGDERPYTNLFLSQDHVMYISEGGFSLSYIVPKISYGELKLNFDFSFSYIVNDGVDKNMCTFGTTANDAKLNWVNNIHTSYNVFVGFGISYRY